MYLNDFKKSARTRDFSGYADPRAPPRSADFVLDAVRDFFTYLETKKYKLHVRVFLSRYRGYTVCPECQEPFPTEARNVYVAGKNIADVCRMTIRESDDSFGVELSSLSRKSPNVSCGRFGHACVS